MMRQTSFGPPLTGAVKKIIIINSAIFFADISLRLLFKSDFIIYYFALVPDLVVNQYFFWQVFSYQFLHGGFLHLLFNMFALWMFGTELEIRWGQKMFYRFYLISGTITGVIILAFNLAMGIHMPTIGASGVVFAIMLAYAVYWGNRLVYIWGIFPLKVKYFVVIMGLISFFSMINPEGSSVSHIGHLGGLLSGYLCLKWVIRDSGHLSSSPGTFLLQKIKMYQKKKQWSKKESDNFSRMSDEEKVDGILQKISQKGMKSLTHDERKFLKETSEKMNKTNIH
jgi:membrane associated rhomboid family serine protease